MSWGIPISLHSAGHASATTTIITVGASAPAGSLIVVLVTEDGSSGAAGTLSDSAGNTYVNKAVHTLNNNAGNGVGMIYIVYNAKPLINGVDTITYVHNANKSIALLIFAITGEFLLGDPTDINVTPTFDLSAVPSIGPSGVPAVKGELFIGAVSGPTQSGAFSQPAGWSSPTPIVVPTSSTPGGIIGTLIEAGNAAHTFAPGFPSSDRWAAFLISIKPGPNVYGFASVLPT